MRGERVSEEVRGTAEEARRMALKNVMRFLPMTTKLEPVTGAQEDDEKCAQRIAEFFEICTNEDITPTYELLGIYLGISRHTLNDWEQKRYKCITDLRAEMIHRAKETLAAYDAQLVVAGLMKETTYIFRSKNYYGMRDQVENVQIKQSDDVIKSLEQIKAEMKLLSDK